MINQERIKNLLLELVQIDSHSRKEREIAQRLKQYCEEMGAQVEIDEAGATDVRVIVPTNHFFDDIDPEVDAAVRAAVAVLASLGASVTELALPRADLISAQRAILLTDAAAYHREHLRERAADIGADVLTRLRTGQTFTGTDYAQARAIAAQVAGQGTRESTWQRLERFGQSILVSVH